MITKQGLETLQQCSRLQENKYWDFEDNFIKVYTRNMKVQ